MSEAMHPAGALGAVAGMPGPNARLIAFTLNGRQVRAVVEPHQTLIDVVRDQFHIGGARESCGQGLCGACTMLVDGKAISSCLYLAAFADGANVLTIEGLGSPGQLHAIQQAFVDNNGAQCGFCTPGMILMAVKLLEKYPNPTVAQIKQYMAGNLCRCASYPEIEQSIQAAARKLTTGETGA